MAWAQHGMCELAFKQMCIRVNAVIGTISLLKRNKHTIHHTPKKSVFYRNKLKYGCRLSSSADDIALCVQLFL
jgi:hypothetical protein